MYGIVNKQYRNNNDVHRTTVECPHVHTITIINYFIEFFVIIRFYLHQVSADGSVDSEITYSIVGNADHFAINSSTGQIDLVQSLDRETTQEVRLEVWAIGQFSMHII